MDEYRCKRCRNIVKRGEHHDCYVHKKIHYYSFLQQPVEADNIHDEGKDKLTENSSSSVQDVNTKENVSLSSTSEDVESNDRHGNDFREAYNISPNIRESTGVEEDTQRGSDIPDLHLSTGSKENEMSRQENRWHSLNNDNIGKPVSEIVIDGYTSLEMQSNLSSENEKTASNVTQFISPQTDNIVVAGPSGLSSVKRKPKTTPKTKNATNNREKRFVCDICNGEFSRKATLDRHYTVHTGETPYVCIICRKLFSQKSNLVAHYRTHTDDKPFTCEICNNQFSQKEHLISHFRTHTGDKPFICPICNRGFARKDNLNTHIWTMHGKKSCK